MKRGELAARLKNEYIELDGKIQRLVAFLGAKEGKMSAVVVSHEEEINYRLMRKQLQAMLDYRTALGARLIAIAGPNWSMEGVI